MSDTTKTAYSPDELKEFEEIILKKLDVAKEELNILKDTISKKNDSGTDHTASTSKLLEDGADTLERESMNQSMIDSWNESLCNPNLVFM